MQEIIYTHIVWIITDLDKSINQQAKEIEEFVDKINKLDIPPHSLWLCKQDYREMILRFYRNDPYSEYKPLVELSEQIAKIIEHNNNMVIFSKYI